jgi:hypothetical protein
MSVTLTAVPAAANGADATPVSPPPEQARFDASANAQGDGLAGINHLANPAALASELLDSLRGYFERAQNIAKATRTSESNRGQDDGNGLTTVAMRAGELDLHGGPARESLEPLDNGVSSPVGASVAELQRTMEVALASMDFVNETALLVRGTAQVSHSANTLLKGQ